MMNIAMCLSVFQCCWEAMFKKWIAIAGIRERAVVLWKMRAKCTTQLYNFTVFPYSETKTNSDDQSIT